MIVEIHFFQLIKLLEDDPLFVYDYLERLKNKDKELAREVLDYTGDVNTNNAPFIQLLSSVVGSNKTFGTESYLGSKVQHLDQQVGIKILDLMIKIKFDPSIKNRDGIDIIDMLKDRASPIYRLRYNNEGYIDKLNKLFIWPRNQNNEEYDSELLKIKNDFQKLNLV